MVRVTKPQVYLIHIDTPIAGRARHYLGWSADLTERLRQHASGTGARLMAAVVSRGITWRVVRTWPGNYKLERELKRRKDSAGLCPVCTAGRRKRKTEAQRNRRAASCVNGNPNE